MRISDWSSDVCSSDLTASASEGQICPLAPGERWAAHNAAPSPAVRAIAACLSPDRQPSSNLSLGFVNLSLDRTDDTVRDPVRHLFHTVSLWRCSAGSSGAGGTGEEQGSRPRAPRGRALSRERKSVG